MCSRDDHNGAYITQFSFAHEMITMQHISLNFHEILHTFALITVLSRPCLLWSVTAIWFFRKTKNVKIGYKIAIFLDLSLLLKHDQG